MIKAPMPSYRNPPVEEVALAVYFSPLLQIGAVQYGRLYEMWSENYPRSEDQPLLPPIPPDKLTRYLMPSIQFSTVSPGVRVWYLSKDGDRVIQIQRDRLILNWRRINDEQNYPSYNTLRPMFEEIIGQFLQFLKNEGLDCPEITQAEVTYVNPIICAGLEQLGDPTTILSVCSNQQSEDLFPHPEGVNMSLRYQIKDPEKKLSIGSLYVEAVSPVLYQRAGQSESQEIFMLKLFARGRPLDPGLEGALNFLDIAHDWVIRGFTSITSPQVHQLWEREE